MKRKNLVVLFGGKSSEYKISLKSAEGILSHIDIRKYAVHPIGITQEGQWYYYMGPFQNIADDTWQKHRCIRCTVDFSSMSPRLLLLDAFGTSYTIDVVFPVLHGRNGEDGSVQGIFEMLQIPIVGCGVGASVLGMDKYQSHQRARAHSVKTADNYQVIGADYHRGLEAWIDTHAYPFVVKPLRAGSSMGVRFVTDTQELHQAIAFAQAFDGIVLVEQYIHGFEISCGVMGNETLIMGALEESVCHDPILDTNEKYRLESTDVYCPARIPHALELEIRAITEVLYRDFGCRVFARFDYFVTKDGDVYFNEVNTIPGFTKHSSFPAMMQKAGWSYETLVDTLITYGISH